MGPLHTMMAQVVTAGTAAQAARVAAGIHGNVAFAMVTVDGGEGGPTDGPHVARFLDLVHSGR